MRPMILLMLLQGCGSARASEPATIVCAPLVGVFNAERCETQEAICFRIGGALSCIRK